MHVVLRATGKDLSARRIVHRSLDAVVAAARIPGTAELVEKGLRCIPASVIRVSFEIPYSIHEGVEKLFPTICRPIVLPAS